MRMVLLNRCRLILTILLLVAPWWMPVLHAGDSVEMASIATELLVPEQVVGADGVLTTTYQFRSANSLGWMVFDHDLYQQLSLELFRPEDSRFEFVFTANLRADLDGNRDLTGFYPFEDLGDAGPYDVSAEVYEARADFNHLMSFLPLLRLGRQTGVRNEALYFDGITAQLSILPALDLVGYGGVSVHFDEIGYSWGSDALAGIGVDFRASEDTRLGLDYLFVADTRQAPLDSDQYDHVLDLMFWQRIAALARFRIGLRLVDFAPRDFSIQTMLTFNSIGLELNAEYAIQPRDQEELANETSDYYDVLGTSAPFQSIDFKIRQLLGTFFTIDIGVYYQSLLAGAVESAFNREYGRVSALVEMADLPLPGLSFSPLVESWFSGDNVHYSAGFDVTYELPLKRRGLSLQAGSCFGLYEYTYYEALGVREPVQTYYVKTEVPLGDGFAARAAYEFERSLEPYHRFDLRLRYEF